MTASDAARVTPGVPTTRSSELSLGDLRALGVRRRPGLLHFGSRAHRAAVRSCGIRLCGGLRALETLLSGLERLVLHLFQGVNS